MAFLNGGSGQRNQFLGTPPRRRATGTRSDLTSLAAELTLVGDFLAVARGEEVHAHKPDS